jgi:hypothetical protein
MGVLGVVALMAAKRIQDGGRDLSTLSIMIRRVIDIP